MMFIQQWSCLTMHFSECVPIVNRHITIVNWLHSKLMCVWCMLGGCARAHMGVRGQLCGAGTLTFTFISDYQVCVARALICWAILPALFIFLKYIFINYLSVIQCILILFTPLVLLTSSRYTPSPYPRFFPVCAAYVRMGWSHPLEHGWLPGATPLKKTDFFILPPLKNILFLIMCMYVCMYLWLCEYSAMELEL